MGARLTKPHPQSSQQEVVLVMAPSIIQILPIKVKVPQTIDIFQITVRFDYRVGERTFNDYVVFERSAAVSETRWRVCGRVHPSPSYYTSA